MSTLHGMITKKTEYYPTMFHNISILVATGRI